GRKITVRHLILHTSGLRDQWSLFEMGGHTLDDRLEQGQVVNIVSRQRGLNFDPGTQHSYSNTGYTLLAEIVHAVSGQTLREFTTERIFRPLGMNSTFFFDDVTEIVPGRAHSYEQEGDEQKQLKRSLLNYDNVGATSLFTTVEDMAKWAGNFTRPTVGDAALIEQVSTNGTLDNGTPINYGFGLVRDQADGRTRVSHSGSDAGFRSQFIYYPEQDFAVIITANVPFNIKAKATQIADLYLPKSESAAPEAKPELSPEDPNADAAPLAGLFARPEYRQHVSPVQLQFEGGKLFRTDNRGERKNAVLRQDGSFDFGDPSWMSFRPVRDAKGQVTALDIKNLYESAPLRYPRVQPSKLNAAGLAPYAGRYHSAELDITYDVRVKGDQLTLSSLWMSEPSTLKQVVTDRFESELWWSSAVLFQRDRAGKIRSLSFNSDRANGVILQRVE
ncbi:serine hydrolase domain-containing protein, partial [Steroidobacter sp.]|uniref:serine hydrolase domain-containing protein n=1 Tax=Steroidobacter sp. TaxID=1978227 RepID=UPI001A5EC656